LWISVAVHILAACGAACLILHFPAPALVAAGGGDDVGEESGPVALTHVAPPARLPHIAMPRVFPDKSPPLRSTVSSALSLPAPALVFMPAPPAPALPAPAITPPVSSRLSRHSGKGRAAGAGKGKSGARGEGRGELAAASALPAAPTAPRLLRSTSPEFPPAARARGEDGTVWVKVRVSASGSVEGASIHRSCGHSDLDAAAVRTARRWMFSPATIGGQPVSAPALVKVNFVIR